MSRIKKNITCCWKEGTRHSVTDEINGKHSSKQGSFGVPLIVFVIAFEIVASLKIVIIAVDAVFKSVKHPDYKFLLALEYSSGANLSMHWEQSGLVMIIGHIHWAVYSTT